MLADQAIIDANMIQVYEKCDPDEFQCRVGECVLDVYVCDGQRDCTNGQDEAKCDSNGGLERFTKRGRRRLESKYLQRMLDSSVRACAGYCLKADGFVCRSFNYHAGKRLCTLSEGNVGTLGALSGDEPQWDYYELTSESVDCDDRLRCPSGKCLRDDQLCDGKNDCGGDDGLDERLCSISPNLRIRLVGGNGDNEGRVEIKAFNFGYGGICDDGFGLDEASVICRQLGFDLGAKEAVLNSQFGSGQGDILLDELSCEGDESDLLNCNFAPWRKHDCSDKEWAGVVCKQEQQECRRDEVRTRCTTTSQLGGRRRHPGSCCWYRQASAYRLALTLATGFKVFSPTGSNGALSQNVVMSVLLFSVKHTHFIIQTLGMAM